MDSVNMSLDDIIAAKRKENKVKGKQTGEEGAGPSGRRIRQRGRGFTKKYESADSAFSRPKNVPPGKWGHDGFEELYGNGKQALPSRYPPVRGGARPFSRESLSKTVKLHITNLASTVSKQDLKDLFEPFYVDAITVHFDERGKSTGTADVVTDRASAEEMQDQLRGIALDGRSIHTFLIDEDERPTKEDSRIVDRLSFSAPTKRSRGINKPSRNYSSVHEYRSNRTRRFDDEKRLKNLPRKKMTDEDLDRELDEYMKKKRTNNSGGKRGTGSRRGAGSKDDTGGIDCSVAAGSVAGAVAPSSTDSVDGASGTGSTGSDGGASVPGDRGADGTRASFGKERSVAKGLSGVIPSVGLRTKSDSAVVVSEPLSRASSYATERAALRTVGGILDLGAGAPSSVGSSHQDDATLARVRVMTDVSALSKTRVEDAEAMEI